MFIGGLSGHQDFLMGELRRGRFVGHEGELEVIDAGVDHGMVGQESEDAHQGARRRQSLVLKNSGDNLTLEVGFAMGRNPGRFSQRL
jgi:hypothetical protein